MARFVEQPVMSFLPDGKRLSLRHGPIDLVIEADGDLAEIDKAYETAQTVFPPILGELMEEFSFLRKPLTAKSHPPVGRVARRMHLAALPFAANHTLTPMIAVAGSVADFVLKEMLKNAALDRAYVNNGGDIALHLEPGTHFDIGICANLETGTIQNKTRIHAEDGIRGVASSGWRGRSHSLGIADAVTVLTDNAAKADVAATLITNAINCHAPYAIRRAPAHDLNPDSDLANQLVTIDVGQLNNDDISDALADGHRKANEFLSSGMIKAAHGTLQGQAFSLFHAGDDRAFSREPISRTSSHHQERAYA